MQVKRMSVYIRVREMRDQVPGTTRNGARLDKRQRCAEISATNTRTVEQPLSGGSDVQYGARLLAPHCTF